MKRVVRVELELRKSQEVCKFWAPVEKLSTVHSAGRQETGVRRGWRVWRGFTRRGVAVWRAGMVRRQKRVGIVWDDCNGAVTIGLVLSTRGEVDWP